MTDIYTPERHRLVSVKCATTSRCFTGTNTSSLQIYLTGFFIGCHWAIVRTQGISIRYTSS